MVRLPFAQRRQKCTALTRKTLLAQSTTPATASPDLGPAMTGKALLKTGGNRVGGYLHNSFSRRVASIARFTRRERHQARLIRASPHRRVAGGRYIPDSASWRPSRPSFRPGFLPTYSHTCAPHSETEKHPPQKFTPNHPTAHTYYGRLWPHTMHVLGVGTGLVRLFLPP